MIRLMKFKYPHDNNLVEKLHACLDEHNLQYVIHDNNLYFTIYIYRRNYSCKQVIELVNRINTSKCSYEDARIENGMVVKNQKRIRFFIDCIRNEKYCSHDCCIENEEEEIRKHKRYLELNGYKVINMVIKNGHHRCKYCGQITEKEIEDLLCKNCREMLGHIFYSEL